MSIQEAPRSGRYHKVILKDVKLWEPCLPEEALEWLPPLDDSASGSEGYPIRSLHLHDPSIPRLYVILQPDGAIWPEGSFYLFWRIAEMGAHESTASNLAGDLAEMMNVLMDGGIDPDRFPAQKMSRPTYYFKAHVKTLLAKGELKRRTGNRKMHGMIGMYRWKEAYRNLKPENEMWKVIKSHVKYTDRHGILQVKEVTSTDMTFKTIKAISTGRFIVDGGKLHPISRHDQRILLKALTELGNTEMLLAHIVALTSGSRMQSTLTLRHSSIVPGVGSNDDPRKYDLYGIEMGEGTLVETKNAKYQTVLLPAWVHHMLHTYINSTRHKQRAAMSPITDDAAQYVFLTRTGRPYYVAEIDQHLFEYSAEKGSALRKFIAKVQEKAATLDANFKYQFHDLRATFGMNLLEDNTKDPNGKNMNPMELIDMLRRRLNQDSIDVTMQYLKYREDHPRVAAAQSELEIHLENIIQAEMTKHEQQRTRNP
jgi:hypothetical protein